MRNIATAAAIAATLALTALAAPATADESQYGNGQYNENDSDYRDQSDHRDRDWNRRDHDRRFDFDRYEGDADRWERGWGDEGSGQYRHYGRLSHWRIIRRVEAQGYYGVRGLRASRHGFGLRAFAFNHRGQPVLLRI